MYRKLLGCWFYVKKNCRFSTCLTFLLSIIAVKSANRACFKNKYYTFKSVSLVALKSRSLAVLQVLKIVKWTLDNIDYECANCPTTRFIVNWCFLNYLVFVQRISGNNCLEKTLWQCLQCTCFYNNNQPCI